jgi:hypothetical protein
MGPAVTGRPGRQVIVMEERHDSRAVQVEIAIMLERLYRDHGLRDLALEGAVVENGDPTPGRFYKLPDACTRTEVALDLLRQGEVSGAEFMAMVHPDFHLHAIELKSQYSVSESSAAQQAVFTYLNALAKASLTAGQNQRLTHLFHLFAPADGSTPPAETMPRIIDGLVALAQELNLNMGSAAQAIQEDRAFWIVTARRSVTMVGKTVAALSHIPRGLIVLDIGAAHTRGVLSVLRRRSVSAAVLSPLSLSPNQRHGDFTQAEYNRKQERRLVGPHGTLGALLEKRHNSPPIFGYPPFDEEAQIMVAVIQAAKAGGGPNWPPNAKTLGLGGFSLIDIRQIGIIQKKPPIVSMQIRVKDNGVTLWAVAGKVPPQTPLVQETLEQALTAMREDILAAKPITARLAPDVIAAFSPDKRAAITAVKEAMKSA